MKRIFYFLKDYKKECVCAPLFKMLEAIFELFVPLVVTAIIDRGIGNQDISYVLKMCGMMLLLAVIGLTCSITAQYFAAKAAVGASSVLRASLFSHIQSLSFSELDTMGTSTLITRMTSDINQVQNGINLTLRLFLRSPFIVFGAMIMAFTIDVKSALIFAVVIVLLSIVVFGIMFSTNPLYKKVQSGLDQILGITRENLTGVRVIRAFCREKSEEERFIRANEDLNKRQKFVGRISGLMNPITYVIINVGIIILIQRGAIQVDSGILTQGQVVALYNYMMQILVELIKLANLIISMSKALACANRIEDVFKIEPEKFIAKEPKEQKQVEKDTILEFVNVGLQYEKAKEESLSDLSFKVKKGETIGVIGGTGSGKTSLVNLIPGFYQATRGQIYYKGKLLQQYTPGYLHENMGVVPQKAQLFKGTIRENLIWGKEQASEEEMMEALRVAQAEEFVLEKEGKLDAWLEQGAKNLSGGQKQRLTIARAVLRHPDVLILDDSASALDYATDAKLRRALQEMEKNMTVFIVSQRAASIMHANKILVLDDGKLVGIGSHEELLKNCSVYQEIYYSQFKKEA